MSEANLPPHDPVHPQSGLHLPSSQGSSQPPHSAQSETSGSHDWQTVPLPQTIQAEDLGATRDRSTAAPAHGTPSTPTVDATVVTGRETELLTLIHDLNACNDHLLQRVAQLENALETSQSALQAEISRSQDQQSSAALAAVSSPHPQIAQLISDIDYAQQDLKQQRVLNETLHAQLAASHEQIAQLERECALLRQGNQEQSQALAQAESNCRDLRVRLQRQQRYTLQFKVALEKSLDVAAQRADAAIYPPEGSAQERRGNAAADNPASIVAMPKTQRIQPWSVDATPSQPDQALTALIEGMRGKLHPPATTPQPVSPSLIEAPAPSDSNPESPVPSQPLATTKPTVDPEAETLFWKDLERVIDATDDQVSSTHSESRRTEVAAHQSEPPTQTESPANPASPADPDSLLVETPMPQTAQFNSNPSDSPQFTEPSPWGGPLNSPSNAQRQPEPAEQDSDAQPQPLVSQPVTEPDPTPTQSHLLDWKQEVEAVLRARAQTSTTPQQDGLPPVLAPQSNTASPSPIVHPLRPQKKLKSLAAVQLPNFPRRKS